MFIAMNRFRVKLDEQEAFAARWLDRDVYLKTVPGFVAFHFLKGPRRDDHVLYASHTLWQTYEDFEGWTRSEVFRAAHASAGSNNTQTIGPPEFEGFAVLQEVNANQ